MRYFLYPLFKNPQSGSYHLTYESYIYKLSKPDNSVYIDQHVKPL